MQTGKMCRGIKQVMEKERQRERIRGEREVSLVGNGNGTD
jgi:hypothetical protein